MTNTPVLLLIFNRPDTAQRTFDQIRKARPKQLFIAADGPRSNKESEKEKCEQSRAIVKNIDWDCDVKTLFRTENLGCKYAITSAITWFFEHVEEGIILEDDCYPSPDFFRFCDEVLPAFRNMPKVMEVAGTNFNYGNKKFGEPTYYFSEYGGTWGWATWKRAWDLFNVEIPDYPIGVKKISAKLKKRKDSDFWFQNIEHVYRNKTQVWDYQWKYTIWKNDGICIIPNYNLISNIGFGPDSTHTYDSSSSVANMPHEVLPLNIIHDFSLLTNAEADDYISGFFPANKASLINRILKKTKHLLTKL